MQEPVCLSQEAITKKSEKLKPANESNPLVLFREKLFAQGVHASVRLEQKD